MPTKEPAKYLGKSIDVLGGVRCFTKVSEKDISKVFEDAQLDGVQHVCRATTMNSACVTQIKSDLVERIYEVGLRNGLQALQITTTHKILDLRYSFVHWLV